MQNWSSFCFYASSYLLTLEKQIVSFLSRLFYNLQKLSNDIAIKYLKAYKLNMQCSENLPRMQTWAVSKILNPFIFHSAMYHNDASFIISILAEIHLNYYIFAVHR